MPKWSIVMGRERIYSGMNIEKLAAALQRAQLDREQRLEALLAAGYRLRRVKDIPDDGERAPSVNV